MVERPLLMLAVFVDAGYIFQLYNVHAVDRAGPGYLREKQIETGSPRFLPAVPFSPGQRGKNTCIGVVKNTQEL